MVSNNMDVTVLNKNHCLVHVRLQAVSLVFGLSLTSETREAQK